MFFKKMLVLNPYPQTPSPREGAECGAAALTPLGATPQTPVYAFCHLIILIKALPLKPMPNPYSAMPSRGGNVAKAFIKILLGFGATPQSVSPKGKTDRARGGGRL